MTEPERQLPDGSTPSSPEAIVMPGSLGLSLLIAPVAFVLLIIGTITGLIMVTLAAIVVAAVGLALLVVSALKRRRTAETYDGGRSS